MLFIAVVASTASAAKLANDFLFTDEGQITLAQGYTHPRRKDVKLQDDVAKKMLPDSAYGKPYFPKSLASFSKAINDIVNGWNAIKGAPPRSQFRKVDRRRCESDLGWLGATCAVT